MKQSISLVACVSALIVAGCGEKAVSDSSGEPRSAPFQKESLPVPKPIGRLEDDPGNSTSKVVKSVETDSTIAEEGKTRRISSPRQISSATPTIMEPSRRPRMPEKPKADETVAGSYEFGGQKVEIDGICSIAESGISCWDMEGQKDSDLERRIQEAIEKQEEYNPGGVSTSIRLGRKNRIVVVKSTRANVTGGSSGQPQMYRSLNAQSFGSSLYGHGYAGFNLESPRRDFDDSEYISYEVLMTAEKPSVRETTLRLNQTETMAETALLDCKVGAKTEYAGYSLSIVAISKGAPRAMGGPGFGGNRPVWTLTIKRSGSPSKQANLSVYPVDAEGKPLSYVDQKGTPISTEEYGREIRTRMEKQRQGGPQMPYAGLGSAVGGTMTNDKGSIEVMMLADPKKVPKLRISGTYSKLIDVTGIPLDPR